MLQNILSMNKEVQKILQNRTTFLLNLFYLYKDKLAKNDHHHIHIIIFQVQFIFTIPFVF